MRRVRPALSPVALSLSAGLYARLTSTPANEVWDGHRMATVGTHDWPARLAPVTAPTPGLADALPQSAVRGAAGARWAVSLRTP